MSRNLDAEALGADQPFVHASSMGTTEALRLWVVGNIAPQNDIPTPTGLVRLQWEFCGVFASRRAALDACRGPSYFIGPCELNVRAPENTIAWPGCEWYSADLHGLPRAESAP